VVFDPARSYNCYSQATELREEYVVAIRGVVAIREEGTQNPNIKTGDIEVFAIDMEIVAKSPTLPFKITEKAMVFGEEITSSPENVDEELRLKYRYLDLRRPSIQHIFIMRHRIIKCIREYMEEMNFVEIETPVLTKSTPEGARDYLVPSRVHKGKFYALPQSPQLFKQILMIGGMDRYFQIVKCFRDEDLRPNRQPEFTQFDMEASFIDEEFIYQVIEELVFRCFKIGGIDLPRPFPRLSYQEAMERYGTDRPDIRFGMRFEDLTMIFKGTRYSIFRKIIDSGGVVKGICVKGKAPEMSKNILQNEYAMKIVPSFGGRGMTWMKVMDGQPQSNITQFFSDHELKSLLGIFDARDGDVIMMIADKSRDTVNKVLGLLRLHVADRFSIIPQNTYSPVWVNEFPLFELKEGRITSQHHPFTMPDRMDFDPGNQEELLSLRSRAYDLVINGEELGGGSIRINDMRLQNKIFKALGLEPEEIELKFGFFLNALKYGAPPHGGLALGLDRMISMVLGTDSIREVIAFPKNRSAYCPLTGAPSPVDMDQLDELGISTELKTGAEKAESKGGEQKRISPVRRKRITIKQVRHVAKLARLQISDHEVKEYQKDLDSILNYVETLNEIDTTDVEPMSHVIEIKNVWREDLPEIKDDPDSLLSNAPQRDGRYYKVPKIIEG
jgi:aspartyl-tRNA synthetase